MTSIYEDDACEAQGFLLKEIYRNNNSPLHFIKAFLMSKFCEINVDDKDGRFRRELWPAVVEEASFGELSFVPITKEDKEIGMEAFDDAGFLYRMIADVSGLSSKQIYQVFDIDEMVRYLPYANECGFDEIIEELSKEIISRCQEVAQ